ncbi:MAG: MarR family transcriptional regulator [Alphaproteobacteria bacterium]|nr:MarR family transcriptional regulator [Alphaproteobacteria bacterium]
MVRLVERLHRLFLDVLRTELRRQGVDDINAVQALLLFNIGESEVVIRDLKDRGYYQGSNVSYNIKKLTEYGYLGQERAPHDRRAVVLRLTEKGLALCEGVRGLQNHLSAELGKIAGLDDDLKASGQTLHQLERAWTDFVRYGRP